MRCSAHAEWQVCTNSRIDVTVLKQLIEGLSAAVGSSTDRTDQWNGGWISIEWCRSSFDAGQVDSILVRTSGTAHIHVQIATVMM